MHCIEVYPSLFHGSFLWCLLEEKKWQADERIPACTLTQALTYFIDVTTPPSQSLLRKLSKVAGQEEDRKRLEALASVIALHLSFIRTLIYILVHIFPVDGFTAFLHLISIGFPGILYMERFLQTHLLGGARRI